MPIISNTLSSRILIHIKDGKYIDLLEKSTTEATDDDLLSSHLKSLIQKGFVIMQKEVKQEAKNGEKVEKPSKVKDEVKKEEKVEKISKEKEEKVEKMSKEKEEKVESLSEEKEEKVESSSEENEEKVEKMSKEKEVKKEEK